MACFRVNFNSTFTFTDATMGMPSGSAGRDMKRSYVINDMNDRAIMNFEQATELNTKVS